VGRHLTNVLLGATVAVALGTGTLAFAVGSPTWGLALAVVHGVAGLVPVVLALRKSRIVRTGWSAARASRWGGAALAVVAVLTVASGLAQALGWRQLGPLSAIQVHVPAAILTGIGVVWHVVVHPPPLRRVVRSRRAITRSLAVGALSAGVWTAVEGAAWALRGFDGRRRWTGSQQVERPLVTQWLDDRPPELDVAAWRLDLGGGRVVALADLLDHPDRREVTAALDCTGGWWAETTWTGVPLSALIRPAAGDRSVEVRSATGYARRLPSGDLEHLLLATHLGGRPLSVGHGAPVRLVAPGRRGFWWVKWVVSAAPSPVSWTAQPPFPLT
jgi:hypothetical protein